MKKIINRFVNAFSIGALMILSFIYAVFFFVSLAYGIFGWKLNEHYKGLYLSKGSYVTGFYFEGIPLQLRSGSMVLPEKNTFKYDSVMFAKNDMQHWHDSLAQKINYRWSYKSDLQGSEVDNFTVDEFTVYVKPHDFKSRIALLLPRLIECLFWSFVCWNGAMFLDRIKQRVSFDENQIFRLRLIGIAAVIYGIIMCVVDAFLSYYVFFVDYNIAPNATMTFYGQRKQSDVFYWIIVGAIFLIVTNAFRQGRELQQEQDLTI
ncbi:hypothetical protein A9P82_02995 [Arachidicoccus ginsenosidimutans]|uniref:DUF2975 domain-containing protein n=1 Tax=Arachidicoccus sp. BS20 TaxID=1850526 RepID=UPI0007F0F1E5|nr:DUF2975 domain-containing protein [Arachidicoccus sp. BS20]ANI88357.1 hypothetical protein A9P82_02995 [Arachidicoccus sp. BS20]